ncbi:uncharacterized protein LOC122981068 [Scomber scombrus]|nr:uncharacterized protein LOC133976975 [Scomber scombrus]
MDGVLEEAAVLCVCKLACSLLFLPSLATSSSPVSFCCCCLQIFTDFLVTVFLSCLCIFETWLTDLTPPGDVIAVRFQLFLSHTYGFVLVLIIPMIAVETLIRLLWPHYSVAHRTAGPTVGSDHQHHYKGEVTVEEEKDSNNSDKESFLPHGVSYLCCLTVWVVIALNVRWRWKQEEVWTATCLHTTNSLIRCLPNLFSPMHSAMNPYWGMALVSLLLFFLITCAGLHRQTQAPAQTERTHTQKNGVNNNGNLVPVMSAPSKPVHPGILVSEPTQSVDPEKTESSCTVHKAYSWNSMQMSARHHGDFVLLSPECLSAERRGQEHERTKRGIPLTFIMEEHMNSKCRSQCGWRQWGFPCLGVNVMIGFVGVLSIFVLPLNLSVNIPLIRTIENLLELCIKPLVSFSANTRITSVSHNATIV